MTSGKIYGSDQKVFLFTLEYTRNLNTQIEYYKVIFYLLYTHAPHSLFSYSGENILKLYISTVCNCFYFPCF